MCNIYSGYVVFGESKYWGEVLFYMGVHHEVDRKIIQKTKYKDCKLLTWETVEGMDISEIKFTHSCGEVVGDKEKAELKKIVLSWLKENETDIIHKMMNDFDWGIRRKAARGIDKKYLPKMMCDSDVNVRCEVAKRIDKNYLPEMMKDSYWVVRFESAKRIDKKYLFKMMLMELFLGP